MPLTLTNIVNKKSLFTCRIALCYTAALVAEKNSLMESDNQMIDCSDKIKVQIIS